MIYNKKIQKKKKTNLYQIFLKELFIMIKLSKNNYKMEKQTTL